MATKRKQFDNLPLKSSPNFIFLTKLIHKLRHNNYLSLYSNNKEWHRYKFIKDYCYMKSTLILSKNSSIADKWVFILTILWFCLIHLFGLVHSLPKCNLQIIWNPLFAVYTRNLLLLKSGLWLPYLLWFQS